MEAILKIGGSLSEDIVSLTILCQKISALIKNHQILIVPGGGEFAESIRCLDKKYRFSDTIAHKMAVLAMDQYGLFLSTLTPNSYTTYSAKENRKNLIPILLPSRFMFQEDQLEHSWNVTSDSIAAFIAHKLNLEKLILIKNVDGIFHKDPKKNPNTELIEELSVKELLNWNKKTSVDTNLPNILKKSKLDCYVVNGKHPKRIKLILDNNKTICTHLLS